MSSIRQFPRSRRALLAAGAAAVVGCISLGAVSLGVASAQTTPTPTAPIAVPGTAVRGTMFAKFDSAQLKERQDKFINTLASKLGVSSDKLQQALKDTEQEVGPVPLLFGPGPQISGAAGFSISITSDLSTVAKAIGISEDQLRRELNGKSFTDVARAHNVDPKTVSSAIKAAREAELDKAAQDGKIPADVVNRIKSNLDNELDMLMTTVHSAEGGLQLPAMRAIQIKLNDEPGR